MNSKHVLPLVTVVVLLANSAAQETNTRSGWKAALCDEYVQKFFSDEGIPEESPPPPLRPDVAESWDDPEVVGLPEMIVRGRTFSEEQQLRKLDKLFAARRRSAQTTRLPRISQALVERDFGKVRVGVYSIFYVPVLIGFSW